MNDYSRELEVKKHLPETWSTFFGSFGRLRPIQTLTIPIVLSKKNAVISSPTASGKTEAVVAPVAEDLIENGISKQLSVVYVSPTRALVNDLNERLSGKLESLGFSLARWTSDHHTFDEDDPSEFLLLTPESLDSALCRATSSFETARFCILDELHLVDGTARGDQLAVLCQRMKTISRNQLTFYALSATFKDDNGSFSYFKVDERVNVGSTPNIEFHLKSWNENVFEELFAEFRKRKLRKGLFFCNSRRETEEIAQTIRKHTRPDSVFVHHGSLEKSLREGHEEELRSSSSAMCACTNSLEVGIDIGDVDVIVLVGPPPSVSSLLQRVGRGNRRTGMALAYGISHNESEDPIFREIFRRALEGKLEALEHKPCRSVAVQQILSVLYQNKEIGTPFAHLFGILGPLEMTSTELEMMLNHLSNLNLLLQMRGLYFCDEKLLNLGEKGMIHSNISSDHGFKVLDRSTGEEIGEVGYLDTMSETLIVGGKAWKVREVRRDSMLVEQCAFASFVPTFVRRRNTGAFYHMLPSSLKGGSVC
jgi:ATP-dependent helicase Lhr and Lhr-like helicase